MLREEWIIEKKYVQSAADLEARVAKIMKKKPSDRELRPNPKIASL